MFTKLFSKYLLIGLSAIVLLAAAQNGLFNKSNSDLALACNPQEIGCDEVITPPAPPTTCDWNFLRNECTSCGLARSVEQDCNGNTRISAENVSDAGCSAESRPDLCSTPTPPAPPVDSCPDGGIWENKGYREPQYNQSGNPICTVYQHTCSGEYAWYECDQPQQPAPEAPAPQQPAPQGPVCTADADTGRRNIDSNGCTRNIHTRADCSEYDGGPYNCPSAPQAPAALQSCFVCDGGSYRSTSSENCPANGNQTCNSSSPDQGSCLGASVGQSCGVQAPAPAAPAVVAPPAVQDVSATAIAVGIGGDSNSYSNSSSSSSSNSTNTVTINNPAQQVVTREVVREVPRTFGNVGVGGTVYTKGAQFVPETLPKTGLAELAWSTLAFIPTGFGLRRFSKVKKALENHPSYIFEDRQFRAGS